MLFLNMKCTDYLRINTELILSVGQICGDKDLNGIYYFSNGNKIGYLEGFFNSLILAFLLLRF